MYPSDIDAPAQVMLLQPKSLQQRLEFKSLLTANQQATAMRICLTLVGLQFT